MKAFTDSIRNVFYINKPGQLAKVFPSGHCEFVWGKSVLLYHLPNKLNAESEHVNFVFSKHGEVLNVSCEVKKYIKRCYDYCISCTP